MSARYRQRIQQFRETTLNLRALAKHIDPTRGVIVEWPDPSRLLDPGWSTFFENTWYETDGAVREWMLRREGTGGDNLPEERLDLRLYVSSHGFLPARRYFLRQALSPTVSLPELGYEPRLEGDVASLFLTSQSADGRTHDESVLQLFRNIVFSIRTYRTDVDARDVAARLQAIAEQNSEEPLDEKRPSLPIQPATPEEKLPPGAEVTVGLPAEPDPYGSFAATDYEVQVQTRGDAVDFSGFRGPQASFRTTKPGDGKLRVQVIDRRTLVSRGVALKVKVGEDT